MDNNLPNTQLDDQKMENLRKRTKLSKYIMIAGGVCLGIVVLILMIIGGGISIILGIIAALGVAALAYISDGEISSAMLYASVALMIVSAVAQLIAGIIGVKNCKKPEKAGTCMVWGIIVAVLCVVGTILNSVGGGSFSVFSLLLGLVLPVLYIIGAGFNKKEYIA